uniref:Uncharacterized protein n=1 Tax=Eutreptiella gymnastica TaxID=73025 RepID=A0A7S4LL51_9EUGL
MSRRNAALLLRVGIRSGRFVAVFCSMLIRVLVISIAKNAIQIQGVKRLRRFFYFVAVAAAAALNAIWIAAKFNARKGHCLATQKRGRGLKCKSLECGITKKKWATLLRH